MNQPMLELNQNRGFLGRLPCEIAHCVIQNLSGKSLFRLKEVDHRACTLVIALLQRLDYWKGLGFAPGSEPDQFQVDQAIDLLKRAGRKPTILDIPISISHLSLRILQRLHLVPEHLSSNPKAVAERAARLGLTELCIEALNASRFAYKQKCMDEAIRGGHLDVVDMLLNLHLVGDTSTARDPTPWSFSFSDAVRSGKIAIAKRLVAHNPNLLCRISPLQWAAFCGKTEEFDEIEINEDEWRGQYRLPSPLILAVMNSHVSAIRKLHELRCPIDVADTYDRRAIHFAAKNGDMVAIEELVELGCSLEVTDKSKQTVLHYAAMNSQTYAITRFVELGCPLDETVVDQAAHCGHTDVIIKLAELRCPIGTTAILHAAGGGHSDVIRKLHELKGLIGAKDLLGETALHYAAKNGHIDAIKELVKLGYSIDATNTVGERPIHKAAQNGHLDAVEELEALGSFKDQEVDEMLYAYNSRERI